MEMIRAMIPSVRQQSIIDTLEKDGKLHFIADLARELDTSESTLRRDLKVLAQTGKISMLRGGGVCLKQNHTELDIDSKLYIHVEEKRIIAQYAVSLVEPGDVIFLDPSSICYFMISDELARLPVTVVTNSCMNMTQLLKMNIHCIMIGGETKKSTNACIGSMAEEIMSRLSFTKCFLGANGLTEEAGITNHDTNERSIKRLAIERSKQAYFLINSNKVGVTTLCQVAEISRWPIIMDHVPDDLKKYPNIIDASLQ